MLPKDGFLCAMVDSLICSSMNKLNKPLHKAKVNFVVGCSSVNSVILNSSHWFCRFVQMFIDEQMILIARWWTHSGVKPQSTCATTVSAIGSRWCVTSRTVFDTPLGRLLPVATPWAWLFTYNAHLVHITCSHTTVVGMQKPASFAKLRMGF